MALSLNDDDRWRSISAAAVTARQPLLLIKFRPLAESVGCAISFWAEELCVSTEPRIETALADTVTRWCDFCTTTTTTTMAELKRN